MSTAYLTPTADGNYTAFTASGCASDYLCIDDPVGSPDDATTRLTLTGTTTPTRQSAALSAYSAGGVVNSVTITARIARSGTGTSTAAIFLRIGSTDYDGDSQSLTTGGSYLNYTQAWTTNPATSAAWTYAALAVLEAGVEVTHSGVFGTANFTQLYATVDYTPGVTFALNGGDGIPGVQAAWERVIKRRNNVGTIEYQNYALHYWDIAVIEGATYDTVKLLQGTRLPSLETTDIDNPNQQATYSSAEIIGAIGGQHVGLQVNGVRITFKVDIT